MPKPEGYREQDGCRNCPEGCKCSWAPGGDVDYGICPRHPKWVDSDAIAKLKAEVEGLRGELKSQEEAARHLIGVALKEGADVRKTLQSRLTEAEVEVGRQGRKIDEKHIQEISAARLREHRYLERIDALQSRLKEAEAEVKRLREYTEKMTAEREAYRIERCKVVEVLREIEGQMDERVVEHLCQKIFKELGERAR